jgi:hypothetical protein
MQYLNNPSMLERVHAHYPGAYAIRVEPGRVFVHCDPGQWNHRDIPGGTVQLGNSPATAALAVEILSLVQHDSAP